MSEQEKETHEKKQLRDIELGRISGEEMSKFRENRKREMDKYNEWARMQCYTQQQAAHGPMRPVDCDDVPLQESLANWPVIIELTESMREVESNPESLTWIENGELQEKDFAASIRFVRGIVAGALLSAALMLLIAMCSGCSAGVPIEDDEYWNSVDGGQEPMGWHTDEERRQLEELEG